MRRVLIAIVLLGMGYTIAYTPVIWSMIVYLIPICSACLLIATIYVLFFGGSKKDATGSNQD